MSVSDLSRGGPSMRHTCTVPFSLDAARSFAPGSPESSEASPVVEASPPNANVRTLALTTPRRKDHTLSPLGRQCTRMTVPFADAVASMAPSRVSAMAATGELWHCSSHTTWRLTQSCTTTDPACACAGRASRLESSSAESAQTPRGFWTVSMVRWTHSVESSWTTALRSSTTTSRARFRRTARMDVTKVRSAMQVWLLVLSTLSRRGDSSGVSPAPTTTSREVQKSISTMRTAPMSSS
mmetsp:Transcript_11294/g.31465  ORF Transcript_11294/g.31465 Transcript_11294/m.31465 type:complete len:239 (-) Transcript_11294:204-920(-)